MASSWDWLWQSVATARAARDKSRLQMDQLRRRAEATPLDESELRLELYTQGRDLAHQLGENWWEMFFEHWRIETLLHRLSRPDEALAIAARAVVETSKSLYDQFPLRADLQLNLVACYMHLDAIFYAELIREVFATLKSEAHSWDELELYYAQQWSFFLDDVDDPNSVDAAWHYLRLSQGKSNIWHRQCALSVLCSTLWQFDRATAEQILGEIAAEYEELARKYHQWGQIARAQMFRAVAERCAGHEEEAQQLYQRSWATQRRAPAPRFSIQIMAIAFHEIAGEHAFALRVCSSEIRIARTHNLPFEEVHARMKRVELLKQAGRDAAPAVARLRAMLPRVKSRAHWEAKLRALEL